MPDTATRLKGASLTIERELAAGGIATVYLAKDPEHSCKVAATTMIKTLNS